MNNEIKEILNQLEYFNEEDYKYYSDFKLNKNQIKQLLDCIANLQEENERLKEDITTMNNYIGKIQKENNILKENAEHNDKVVDKAKWNEMIYKSRNKKAIEELDKYINSCEIEAEHTLNNEKCLRSVNHSKKVKNILQGSDKE